jgi:hypothetical protein
VTGLFDFVKTRQFDVRGCRSPGAERIESPGSFGIRTLTLRLLISSVVWIALACQADSNDHDDERPASARPASRLIPQVMPALDIKKPPEDAEKTSFGLAYKKFSASNRGAPAAGRYSAGALHRLATANRRDVLHDQGRQPADGARCGACVVRIQRSACSCSAKARRRCYGCRRTRQCRRRWSTRSR